MGFTCARNKLYEVSFIKLLFVPAVHLCNAKTIQVRAPLKDSNSHTVLGHHSSLADRSLGLKHRITGTCNGRGFFGVTSQVIVSPASSWEAVRPTSNLGKACCILRWCRVSLRLSSVVAIRRGYTPESLGRSCSPQAAADAKYINLTFVLIWSEFLTKATRFRFVKHCFMSIYRNCLLMLCGRMWQ